MQSGVPDKKAVQTLRITLRPQFTEELFFKNPQSAANPDTLLVLLSPPATPFESKFFLEWNVYMNPEKKRAGELPRPFVEDENYVTKEINSHERALLWHNNQVFPGYRNGIPEKKCKVSPELNVLHAVFRSNTQCANPSDLYWHQHQAGLKHAYLSLFQIRGDGVYDLNITFAEGERVAQDLKEKKLAVFVFHLTRKDSKVLPRQIYFTHDWLPTVEPGPSDNEKELAKQAEQMDEEDRERLIELAKQEQERAELAKQRQARLLQFQQGNPQRKVPIELHPQYQGSDPQRRNAKTKTETPPRSETNPLDHFTPVIPSRPVLSGALRKILEAHVGSSNKKNEEAPKNAEGSDSSLDRDRQSGIKRGGPGQS